MKLPDNVKDTSVVRIGVQVDGSFNDTIEITGAELKKLAGLLGSGVKGTAEPKLVAGDGAAEQRETTQLVTIEKREDADQADQTRTVNHGTKTEAPNTTSNPDVKE